MFSEGKALGARLKKQKINILSTQSFTDRDIIKWEQRGGGVGGGHNWPFLAGKGERRGLDCFLIPRNSFHVILRHGLPFFPNVVTTRLRE